MQHPLAPKFQKPAGFIFERLTVEGGTLRLGLHLNPTAKALVFISTGLSEFIERYFEVSQDLYAAGYSVAVMDWRGQGRSVRTPQNQRLREGCFAQDLKDLEQAMAFARKQAGTALPVALLAHSMGGATALHYLAKKQPAFVVAAGFTSPMLALPVPLWAYGVLERVAKAYPPQSIFWGHDKPALVLLQENKHKLTTSVEHQEMTHFWLETEPDLQMGRLSFGWVQQAFEWTKWLHCAENLGHIKTPCLFGVGGHEKVVNLQALRCFPAKISKSESLQFPVSCHEILMEKPEIRQVFLNAFIRHVDRHI